MGTSMTHRERVCAALRRESVDYVPCSPTFNNLTDLQRRGRNYTLPWGPSIYEQLRYCCEQLDLDMFVPVSLAGYASSPGVTSQVWMDGSTIHKRYSTPAGDVEAAVAYDPDLWPHGMDIPFFSDFLPAHATKMWIENEHDLECFRHIMCPVAKDADLQAIRFRHAEAKRMADKWRLATRATGGYGLTGALHLFGPTQLCMLTIDNPALVHEYLEMEHQINLRNIEIAADLGVDVITRNGYYETADFYSPKMLHDFLYDRISAEANLAHEAGIIMTYTVHTGVMQILDHLRSLPVDCLNSIDMAFHGVDLATIRDSQQGTKSFIIGPNNTQHTQAADPYVCKDCVRACFEVFGKTGLLIAPCPSFHAIHPWDNALAMIGTWKKLREA